MASLADYANNPEAVAYLKALYAQQQAGPQPQVGVANSTDVVPFDAGLTQANLAADTNYKNTLAAIDAQQPIIQRRYGFTDAGDIDPNNPFGQAQLLKRSYDQSQRGNTNSYASRGQLYSGALQRAKDDAQFNYQANDAAMRNQYSQDLAGLSAQRAAAANQLNTSKSANYWDWVNSQIAARAAGVGNAPPPAPEPTGNVAGYGGDPGGYYPGLPAAPAPGGPDAVAYAQAVQAAQQQQVAGRAIQEQSQRYVPGGAGYKPGWYMGYGGMYGKAR